MRMIYKQRVPLEMANDRAEWLKRCVKHEKYLYNHPLHAAYTG